MVVKKIKISLLCLFACWLVGCSPNTGTIDLHARLQIIDKAYLTQTPLVSLIDMPVYTEKKDSFVLGQDGKVRVYSVGELIYNLAESRRDCFFKGDDITLYFQDKTPGPVHPVKTVYLSWSEATGRKGRATIKKDGILFEGCQYNDSVIGKYVAEIKIPWARLPLRRVPAQAGDTIGFDIVIGDTDDEFTQKAKMGWCPGAQHPAAVIRGSILLAGKKETGAIPGNDHTITAINNSITVDSITELTWNKSPAYILSNVFYGIVKDKYDLNTSVRASWDTANLYLLLDIQDGNRRRIWSKTVRAMQTFSDYGWVEDEHGRKIWEMHALDSKSAGGALKNQYTDTLLSLKKGKYLVKYTSDESHAFNDWDDDPPATPFYGIVVYKVP